MGTNYYLHKKDAEPVHIGKSSYNKKFLFAANKVASTYWFIELARANEYGSYILDEYGQKIDPIILMKDIMMSNVFGESHIDDDDNGIKQDAWGYELLGGEWC